MKSLINGLGAVVGMCLVVPCVLGYESKDYEQVVRFAYAQMSHDAQVAYGEQDYNVAFTKFHRLACAGDKPSQFAVGRMYLLGQGTSRNDVSGYAWLKVAAEYPFPIYRAAVKEIDDRITPEQKSILGAKADEADRLYGLRATNTSCRLTSSSSLNSNMKDEVVCTPQRQRGDYLLRRCVDSASFESETSDK